jgi:predicted nucleic acid-binding protein
MIIVSNTSPLNNLAAIDQLDLLRELYSTIMIPEGVYQELMAVETPIHVSTQIQTTQWIKVEKVASLTQIALLQQQLDRGEAEAIALAIQVKADLLLIDEKQGRRVANNLNITFTGILGILITAKQKGLIKDVKPLLEKLKTQAGFWIKPNLYQNILQRVGE